MESLHHIQTTFLATKMRRKYYTQCFTGRHPNHCEQFNQNKDFIGYCYRGENQQVKECLEIIGYKHVGDKYIEHEIPELPQLLSQDLIKTGLFDFMNFESDRLGFNTRRVALKEWEKSIFKKPRDFLNWKTFYADWVYYGNYSFSLNAFINKSPMNKCNGLSTPKRIPPPKLSSASDLIFFPDVMTDSGKQPAGPTKASPYLASALHWAVLGGNLQTVKLLCSCEGIDVNSKISAHHATPKTIAKLNCLWDIYHFLNNFPS
eukprot:TRINITY_DN2070_c0_g1_i1.p1 TRINITY_DN2070_c0_g1~~TRINITY_DN2070_c0_g1_i1.p1  ORF type:complete len:261 (+),score=28.27 TRINITY_DN2070_c0_g1_i1:758-1540(+)